MVVPDLGITTTNKSPEPLESWQWAEKSRIDIGENFECFSEISPSMTQTEIKPTLPPPPNTSLPLSKLQLAAQDSSKVVGLNLNFLQNISNVWSGLQGQLHPEVMEISLANANAALANSPKTNSIKTPPAQSPTVAVPTMRLVDHCMPGFANMMTVNPTLLASAAQKQIRQKRERKASTTSTIKKARTAKKLLPMDHRPARGRGRQIQLKSMTKAQIKAETIVRNERNRLAAKESRIRRKRHMEALEAKVSQLEAKDCESQEIIKELRSKLGNTSAVDKSKDTSTTKL